MALCWESAGGGRPCPSTYPVLRQSSTVLDPARASVYHAAPALAPGSGQGQGLAFGRRSPDPVSPQSSSDSEASCTASPSQCTTARQPSTRPPLSLWQRLSEPSMPTVPPTFVPIAAYDHAVPPVAAHAPFPVDPFLDRERDDAASGPTPDPDVEDFTVVPVDNGNAVTEADSERPPALAPTASFSGSRTSRPSSPSSSPSRKPRLSLGALSLHSPSSAIVGTPFNLSPRFEYPFPSVSASTVSPSSALDHDGFPYPYGHVAFGAYGHGHVPGWAGFPVSASLPNLSVTTGSPFAFAPGHPWVIGPGAQRAHSPTHPKLHLREPPVPPSLAKKRRVMRERALGPCSEVTGAPRPGANEVVPPRRMFTEPELGEVMQMDTVRQQSLPLPDEAGLPRPASLERRESDETVVGSAEGRSDDDDEKIALREVCPPAVTLITSAEDTQAVSPTLSLGLVATEEPEVMPTTVADVQLVQGDGRGEADDPVSPHGSPRHLPGDRSPLDARLDTLPAFPLATLATSPSAACTSELCPVFHDTPAAAPTDDASTGIDTRSDTLPDTAPRQGAAGPHEQIHEPHDTASDIHARDTTVNAEAAPAPIHDGAWPSSSDSPALAPAIAASPSDS